MNLFLLLFGVAAGYAIKTKLNRGSQAGIREDESLGGWEGVDPCQNEYYEPDYEPEAIEW